MPWTAPTDPKPVSAKFYVKGVSLESYGTIVTLLPVTKGEENKEWSKYTPSGELKMTITNEQAAQQFWPNQEWFIDLRPAPEATE